MSKQIRIDGPVGMFMTDSESFAFELQNLNLQENETLEVVINSPGGSVIEGWGIYNQLKSLNNKVVTKVEGLAASIASLIALAGDEVHISEVGSIMIHRASTFAEGNQKDLEKQIETLKTIDETLITVYQAKSGENREQVEEWLDEEKWFTADEAVEIGFADEIINKVDSRMAALYLPKTDTMNKFEKLMAYLNGEEVVEEVVEETTTEETAAEETQDNQEEETEALTKEDVAKMIKEALKDDKKDILDAIQTLSETFNKHKDEAEQLTTEIVKKVARGITTNGKPPVSANTTFETPAEKPEWTPQHQGFKDRIAEIDKNTRN